MNGPELSIFKTIISIDKKSNTKIYLQIAQQLINAIQRGYLEAGQKIPGTRVLSQLLEVHRQTVVIALEELQTQGWLEIKPNIGTFVLNPIIKKKQFDVSKIKLNEYAQASSFNFKKSSLLDNPFEDISCKYNLDDGQCDERLCKTQQTTVYQDIKESKQLKKNLSTFLNQSRGLHIGPENIAFTNTKETCLNIISQLILEENEVVLIGELSYFSSNMIFQNAKAKLKLIPLDEFGIDVDYIKENFCKDEVKAVYVTPQHHYPTTVTLSVERRLKLLELANEYNFIIIEDDYDYEFQYENSSLIPIASADTFGKVIYIGNFGKSLPKDYQLGFVIAPKDFIKEVNKHISLINPYPHKKNEAIISELIREGEVHRQLKKAIKIYKERRNFCITKLNEVFGSKIFFQIPTGGLAIWINFTKSFSIKTFINECQKNGVHIPNICQYQSKKTTAIRFGFGKFNDAELDEIIQIMHFSYQSIFYDIT